MRRHRADDSITKTIRRITRVDLIIVDDIGMLGVGEDAAEGFYRFVDACYETRLLAVSSNLHPAGFDEITPKTLATATLDRLLHHAHNCVTTGDSLRLAQTTTSKGGDAADHRDQLRRTRVRPRGHTMATTGEIS